MLFLLPQHVPPLALILEDIGNPSARELARSLGVTERTAYRWKADPDHVPRLVVLALFWLTRWGQSAVDCQARNTATLYAEQARATQRELELTRADLARVMALGQTGAANDATQRVRPLAPVFAFGRRPSPPAVVDERA